MEHKDNIHYSFNSLDGYDRPINFIVSPRGDGKTTAFLVNKAWKAFKEQGLATIIQRRYITDITEKYIASLAGIINKFTDADLRLSYKMTQLKKDGIIDVYASNYEGKRIFTILAINTRLTNLKGLFQSDTKYWLCDEFICNPKLNEKYVKGEAFKFREAFNTLARENFAMKAYFLGNPYSLYNPYFMDLGIDPAKVSRQQFTAGGKWAVEYHRLTPELRQYYLDNNPMYSEGDAYTDYALEGIAVLDKNILIEPTQPMGFELMIAFTQGNMTYGIFRCGSIASDLRYWVGKIEGKLASRRHVIVFGFDDLEEGTTLFGRYEREMLAGFASAMRKREVGFCDLNCAYACQEIYGMI